MCVYVCYITSIYSSIYLFNHFTQKQGGISSPPDRATCRKSHDYRNGALKIEMQLLNEFVLKMLKLGWIVVCEVGNVVKTEPTDITLRYGRRTNTSTQGSVRPVGSVCCPVYTQAWATLKTGYSTDATSGLRVLPSAAHNVTMCWQQCPTMHHQLQDACMMMLGYGNRKSPSSKDGVLNKKIEQWKRCR